MKPEVDQVLRVVTAKLLGEVAPAVGDAYVQGQVEAIAALIAAAADEYDRAAHVRVEENRRLRKLFADTAPLVSDPALRATLSVAAETIETSFRIADLNALNDRLRALLIDLHAFVESCGEEWASRANRAIWAELRTAAAARAISFYPL